MHLPRGITSIAYCMGTVAEIVIKRREQEREGGGRENVREGERGGEGRGEGRERCNLQYMKK